MWLIAIAVAYLYSFPYFPRIHSANELPRVYLVKAIADDHTFAIDGGIRRWSFEEGGGTTADVTTFDKHSYSNKAPGSSMLAVPPYLAAKLVAGEPSLATTVWICRVFTGVIPMLLFLVLLYRFLERYAPDPAIRRLVCIAYALGSMAMTYSILYFSHQLAAICVASAWMIGVQAAERTRGLPAFAIAGGLAGASVLVDYQAVFAAVPAAVHIISKLRGWRPREIAIAIGIAVLAAAVPIAILLGYHAACFGSPWNTGYGALTGDKLDQAQIAFAANHQEGFLGLTKLRWDAFAGSLFKPDNGLFALSPWLLLALPGFYWLARGDAGGSPAETSGRLVGAEPPSTRAPVPIDRELRRRVAIEVALGVGLIVVGLAIYLLGLVELRGRVFALSIDLPIVAGCAVLLRAAARVWHGKERATAAVGIAALVIYVLFVSAIKFWRGGWGVGPRYITALLPFLLPAVAATLTVLHRKDKRAIAAVSGLIVVGVVIYVLSSLTFPYWPDTAQGHVVKHPLVDVTFALLGDNVVAPNIASAVGIDGVLGVVPVMLLVGALLALTIRGVAGERGVAIAGVVAAGLLVGYALLPHGGAGGQRAHEFARSVVER
jgi:hypothetical protein